MGCICFRGLQPCDSSNGRSDKRRHATQEEEYDVTNDDYLSTRLASSYEWDNDVVGTSGNSLSLITNVEEGQSRKIVNRIGSLNRGERGAQVLAGWPSWLSAVAGEAISGWIPSRPESFEKLEKVKLLLDFFFLRNLTSLKRSYINSLLVELICFKKKTQVINKSISNYTYIIRLLYDSL